MREDSFGTSSARDIAKTLKNRISPDKKKEIISKQEIRNKSKKAWQYLERRFGINPQSLQQTKLSLTSGIMRINHTEYDNDGEYRNIENLTMIIALNEDNNPVLIGEIPWWIGAKTGLNQIFSRKNPKTEIRQNMAIELKWYPDEREGLSQWSDQEPPLGFGGHFKVMIGQKGSYYSNEYPLKYKSDGVLEFNDEGLLSSGSYILHLNTTSFESINDLIMQSNRQNPGINAINLAQASSGTVL